MKKGIFDIHLMKRPTFRGSNRKDSSHCSHLSHRSKSLLIVHSILLPIAKCNQTGLISIQSPIGTQLDRINPFATNRFHLSRTRDNIPCMIILKSLKFISHRPTPTIMFSGRRISGRNRNGRQSSMKRGMGETIPIRRTRHSGRTTRNCDSVRITRRRCSRSRLKWRIRLRKGQSRMSSFIDKARFEANRRRSQVIKIRQDRHLRQRLNMRRKE
ncbi:hypothetical protein I3843_16G065400 [Carya illinoinensis]|nr:hypothetical protein I3843_16G065400 [Carya illinoinensis]